MKPQSSYIITIDGYSSCGKSTFARLIATELNYIYIDSGAMYRTVALYCLNHDLLTGEVVNLKKLQQSLDTMDIRFKLNPASGIQETWLNGENVEKDIRSIAVSNIVSKISQIKAVREKMVKLQRTIGQSGGVVMEGRDIGTVVFPGAHLKIFMTADTHIRAERRFKELTDKGVKVSFNEIADNIRMRDYEDENRKESPLRKAKDSVVLDNSNMSIEQQMEWFRSVWEKYDNENKY
jgi:CMP/dCMP kinase